METTQPSEIQVVRGIILDSEGNILIMRRAVNYSRPLKWETPGGKVEPGQTAEEAFHDEILHETGFEVESLVDDVSEHRSQDKEGEHAGKIYVINHRIVKVTRGTFQSSGEHDAHSWQTHRGALLYNLTPECRTGLTNLGGALLNASQLL